MKKQSIFLFFLFFLINCNNKNSSEFYYKGLALVQYSCNNSGSIKQINLYPYSKNDIQNFNTKNIEKGVVLRVTNTSKIWEVLNTKKNNLKGLNYALIYIEYSSEVYDNFQKDEYSSFVKINKNPNPINKFAIKGKS